MAGLAAGLVFVLIEMAWLGHLGKPAVAALLAFSTIFTGASAPTAIAASRFSTVVHWTYGTSWGAVRGLLHAAGVDGLGASAVHFGAVWGSEQVMLPVLHVAPPLWEWGKQEIPIDALHHAV